nr:hypothetical protein CFP56_02474 [Quercus suber]
MPANLRKRKKDNESSFQSPRPLFPPRRPPKGLARLVTKALVKVAKGKEATQGRTRPEAKGKGASHGKEVSQAKPLLETKGLMADQGKETISKTKKSELVKPQAVAQEKKATSSKAADPLVPQPVNKEDPRPTQT